MATIKEQIDTLKKAIANPIIPDGLKEGMKTKLAALEKSESSEAKPEKKPAKIAKKVVKKKVDGEVVEFDCEKIIAQIIERKAKAKKASKKAPKPVMDRISTDVQQSIVKAVKNIPTPKLKSDTSGYVNKLRTLESAAVTFLKAFKSILGGDFSAKEISDFEDTMASFITELKDKYSKKTAEKKAKGGKVAKKVRRLYRGKDYMTSKKDDLARKAKPIGYRYKDAYDSRGNRIKQYQKPKDYDIKYNKKQVYYENRPDRSDKSLKEKI